MSSFPADAAPRTETISGAFTVFFATTVGIIVTNLFAPQTLVGLIAPSIGFDQVGSGLIAMTTLLGYAAGLFFLVPLADLLENRLLIVRMLTVATLAAATVIWAPTATALLMALFTLGAACSAIQILVPIAASMAPPARRGRVIGDVMGGVMIGIVLARPLASLLADAWGWRGFYVVSAGTMAVLTTVLWWHLPVRQPATRLTYPSLLASLFQLLRDEPVLRRRAFTAALAMAAFSLFWTSVALRLAQPPFGLSQRGIALFALIGAAGAAVTPMVGRIGDRGWTRPATILSHVVMLIAFAIAAWADAGETNSTSWLPLALMSVSAILLDIAVTGDQTLGRRAINMLQPEARGRINGLFVGLFFLGGAAGSALTGLAWDVGGWTAICAAGAAISVLALLFGVYNRNPAL